MRSNTQGSNANPPQLSQLLGLVFAGADLVFEVDERGVIRFALGAAESLTDRSEAALVGVSWKSLVSDADGDLLLFLEESAAPGERLGPFFITLAASREGALGRPAVLSVFRLPGEGAPLSCALSAASAPPGPKVGDGGMVDMVDALLSTVAAAGPGAGLGLVDLTGFTASLAHLPAEASRKARRRLQASLRAASLGGAEAVPVAEGRYVLVQAEGGALERLSARMAEAGGGGWAPQIAQITLPPAPPALNAKAVRYALDRFIEAGPAEGAAGFRLVVEEMMQEATCFRAVLDKGTFDLAYQPVIRLQDETLHHYEALSRFAPDTSPAKTLRLAEELGMIMEFDLCVLRSVAAELAAGHQADSIAVNISALSLTSPGYVASMIEATARHPSLRPRLLIEVTETQRLADLDAAQQAIQALRSKGHKVCLDDFGAGAATFDYLQKLAFDIVKLDGRFVRRLKAGSREAVLIRHVAAMCREMHVVTIAEMVETQDAARLLRELGVDLGQGWAFGAPTAARLYEPKPTARRARRSGVVESWG